VKIFINNRLGSIIEHLYLELIDTLRQDIDFTIANATNPRGNEPEAVYNMRLSESANLRGRCAMRRALAAGSTPDEAQRVGTTAAAKQPPPGKLHQKYAASIHKEVNDINRLELPLFAPSKMVEEIREGSEMIFKQSYKVIFEKIDSFYEAVDKRAKLQFIAKLNSGDISSNGDITALNLACEIGRESVVKKLITLGARVASNDVGKLSPMATAVKWNNVAVMNILGSDKEAHYLTTKLGPGGRISRDKGESFLILAAQYNHVEALLYLLDKGADINEQIRSDILNRNGKTPLMMAIALSYLKLHVECIRVLIHKGADDTIKDGEGNMPLTEPLYQQILGETLGAEVLLDRLEQNNVSLAKELLQEYPDALPDSKEAQVRFISAIEEARARRAARTAGPNIREHVVETVSAPDPVVDVTAVADNYDNMSKDELIAHYMANRQKYRVGFNESMKKEDMIEYFRDIDEMPSLGPVVEAPVAEAPVTEAPVAEAPVTEAHVAPVAPAETTLTPKQLRGLTPQELRQYYKKLEKEEKRRLFLEKRDWIPRQREGVARLAHPLLTRNNRKRLSRRPSSAPARKRYGAKNVFEDENNNNGNGNNTNKTRKAATMKWVSQLNRRPFLPKSAEEEDNENAAASAAAIQAEADMIRAEEAETAAANAEEEDNENAAASAAAIQAEADMIRAEEAETAAANAEAKKTYPFYEILGALPLAYRPSSRRLNRGNMPARSTSMPRLKNTERLRKKYMNQNSFLGRNFTERKRVTAWKKGVANAREKALNSLRKALERKKTLPEKKTEGGSLYKKYKHNTRRYRKK
jgi:hypothetical protein